MIGKIDIRKQQKLNWRVVASLLMKTKKMNLREIKGQKNLI